MDFFLVENWRQSTQYYLEQFTKTLIVVEVNYFVKFITKKQNWKKTKKKNMQIRFDLKKVRFITTLGLRDQKFERWMLNYKAKMDTIYVKKLFLRLSKAM